MLDKLFHLTEADSNAVMLGDADYINNKGANLYRSGDFADAVEYYRLAAAMGSVHAVSNLGYCYLYGRDVEADLSLALAYFKTAALKDDVDAAYKLGDVYGSDKWGIQDKELSVYYYGMAASLVLGREWDSVDAVVWCEKLQQYPSLCYALGRELSGGGELFPDMERAYQFLKHAEIGYKIELRNGNDMYERSYEGVLALLADPRFDEIRAKYDDLFAGSGDVLTEDV